MASPRNPKEGAAERAAWVRRLGGAPKVFLAAVSRWLRPAGVLDASVTPADPGRDGADPMLSTLLDSLFQGVLVVDAQLRIVRINKAGLFQLRVAEGSRPTSLGDVPYDLVEESGAAIPFDRWIRNLIADRGTDANLTIRVRDRRSGDMRTARVCVSPLVGLGQPAGSFVVSFDDITAFRAQNEALTRLYATLTQVNQAIVRTRTRDALFSEICRVAIEFGRFRGAWIVCRDGPGGQPRVAVSRLEEPDGELAGFPVATACRVVGASLDSGRTVVIVDTKGQLPGGSCGCDIFFAGVQSCAGFPLRTKGQVCATLVIGSLEANYFNREEITLLEEVASDVSYALDKLADDEDRQLAEERLRRSEATLAEGLRIAQLAHFERFDDHAASTWSHEMYNIFGRDPSLGVPSLEEVQGLYTPDSWIRINHFFAEARRTGAPYVCDAEIVRPDGSRRWVISRGVGIRDPSGAVIGVRGAIQDITDRKRSEAALREREGLLRLYAEHSPAATAMFDRDMRYIIASRSWIEYYKPGGLPLVGRSHYEVFPQVPERWKAAHRRCLEGAVERCEEDSMVLSDGSTVWLRWEARPWYTDDARIGGIIIFSEDITFRKGAEQAILERSAFIEAQLEASLDAILAVDEKGRILYRNGRFNRTMGIPEALSGTHDDAPVLAHVISLVKHPDRFERRIADLYAHPEEVGRDEVELADGRILDRFSAPIVDGAGRHYGRIWTFRDITEARSLEAQLLRAQRLEAIGTLSSGIAHDLNNILAPMLMATGLLRDEVPGEHARELLSMIEGGAQRGASIIRQLLTFSRGIDGARVSVQVRHLISDMCSLAKETFPKAIKVSQFVAPDLRTVLADSTQLHQVLMNLCVNARDAMPNGGTLRLAAANVTVAEGEQSVSGEIKTGEYVLVSVTDTGQGIPSGNLEKIFDPFFTTKGPGQGTGLGLSTALGIITSHGGFIRVESEVGRGTNFLVFLPAEREGRTEKSAAPKAAPPVGRRELVLVVDDEPSILAATRATLEQGHYRVILASNGAEGLAQFRSHGPVRLAIVDQMMPVMGGRALIKAIRELDPKACIIAVTGMDHMDQREELRALGAAEVLIKPYSAQVLLETVATVLADTQG